MKAFSNLLVSKNHHALVIGNPFDTLGANVYGGSTKSSLPPAGLRALESWQPLRGKDLSLEIGKLVRSSRRFRFLSSLGSLPDQGVAEAHGNKFSSIVYFIAKRKYQDSLFFHAFPLSVNSSCCAKSHLNSVTQNHGGSLGQVCSSKSIHTCQEGRLGYLVQSNQSIMITNGNIV